MGRLILDRRGLGGEEQHVEMDQTGRVFLD